MTNGTEPKTFGSVLTSNGTDQNRTEKFQAKVLYSGAAVHGVKVAPVVAKPGYGSYGHGLGLGHGAVVKPVGPVAFGSFGLGGLGGYGGGYGGFHSGY